MIAVRWTLGSGLVLASLLAAAIYAQQSQEAKPAITKPAKTKAQPKRVEKRTLPKGELGRVIELGRTIVENTKEHPLSKPYVGNA